MSAWPGHRPCPAAVLCLLFILPGHGLAQSVSTRQDSAAAVTNDFARLKLLFPEYISGRLTAGNPAGWSDQDFREKGLLGELEKKHRLPSGSLARQFAPFGKQLAADRDASLHSRAQGAFAANDYAQAEQFALDAVAQSRQSLATDRFRVVNSLTLAGWCAYARQDRTQALAHVTEAARLADKYNEPLQWTTVHRFQAALHYERGDYVQHERLYRQILPVLEQSIGAEHPETLRSRSNLADGLFRLRKFTEAETEIRALIPIEERLFGPNDQLTLRSQDELASILSAQERHQEAETRFRNILRARQRVLGPEHPDTLSTRINLASSMEHQGKRAEAESELREVEILCERVLGPHHPKTLKVRQVLAIILRLQRKYKEAYVESKTLLGLRERVLGREHPDTLSSWNEVANGLFVQRRFAEAETEFGALSQVQARVLGPEHPDTLYSLSQLAVCQYTMKKPTEARESIRRALDGHRKTLGPEHRDTKAAERLYNLLAPKK